MSYIMKNNKKYNDYDNLQVQINNINKNLEKINVNYGLITDVLQTYKSMSASSVLYGLSWEIATNSHPLDTVASFHTYTFIKTDNPDFNRIIIDVVGHGIFYGRYVPSTDSIDWRYGRALIIDDYNSSTKTLYTFG